ncbi:histone-lysine N-methyltransferase SETMAR [Elysia marginata]|uniref:Histone-lysine N-methyltransferase SETMAR n=1 Tax=Elysia marginata TaxID=1093978 RepID=A0AAV4EKU5_9GAST|nr:histone-lysine N-methyltransferase SETMAR [Elysia marginata]
MLPNTAALLAASEMVLSQKTWTLKKGRCASARQCDPSFSKPTQQWLQRYGWEILPHPAHSPDLAPSDFYLFGPLKRHLGGMAFETEGDLVGELKNRFAHLDLDFFRVGIYSLLLCWKK